MVEPGLNVIGMEDQKIQIEVGAKFIGSVVTSDKVMSMVLQAAGVKKALAAVSKICKAGNIVQFGDDPAECYIKNKSTGKNVMMEKRRGSGPDRQGRRCDVGEDRRGSDDHRLWGGRISVPTRLGPSVRT